MSQFARVTDVEVLVNFKAALAGFAETAGLGLSEAQSDVQRTVWWIQQDRLSHWQRELKKRTDKLNQAKAELFKKQLESNDTRTSAVVERKNVVKAEAARDEAEHKIKAVKKWGLALDREFMLFKAACAQVAGAVAGDIPGAIITLNQRIDALRAYLALQAPTADPARVTLTASEPEQASAEHSSVSSLEGKEANP